MMMMADNPKITVEVEAKGVDGVEKKLDGVGTAGKKAEKSTSDFAKAMKTLADNSNRTNLLLQQVAEHTKKVERSTKKTSEEVRGLSHAMKGLVATALTYVGIGLVKSLADTADKFKLLQARVENASKSVELGAYNFEQLKQIAIQTGAEIDTVISTFQRLSLAKNSIGATNTELLEVTASVAKLGAVGGASVEEVKNATIQFGQALLGAKIQAEEFNSIRDALPKLLDKLSEGLGVSIGQLRQMLLDGKLLSKDVFSVLVTKTKEIDYEFGKFPATFQRLGNAISITFGSWITNIDKATDLSGTLIRFVERTGITVAQLEPIITRLVTGSIYGFKALGNVVLGVFSDIAGVIGFTVENSLRVIKQMVNAVNGITSKINLPAIPTDGIQAGIDASKPFRKNGFKNATNQYSRADINVGKAVSSVFGKIPTYEGPKKPLSSLFDKRGATETIPDKAKKAKKEGKTDAEKEAERQAKALAEKMKDLKRSLLDATTEATLSGKALEALSTGGLKAFEAQLKQNDAVTSFNSLMGDYLNKGNKQLEQLARQAVAQKQSAESLAKQADQMKNLKQAQADAQFALERELELRKAFEEGGIRAYELKEKELEQRERERALLGDGSLSDANTALANEVSLMEAKKTAMQTTTEKMVENAKQASESIRTALRSAFDNTIEHMVNGTSSFKDIMVGLLRQVAVQLIKVYTLKLLTGIIGGHMTGGVSAGAGAGNWDKLGNVFDIKAIPATGKATGGAVNAGQPYMVGETRPELFVPRTAGNIIAHPKAMASGGGTVQVINNMTINTSGKQNDATDVQEAGKELLAMMENKVRQVLRDESRQGGMLQRSFA